MTSSDILEKGDLVLITGATGWIGNHIANQALKYGFRLRLAVRNSGKASTLVKALKAIHGQDAPIELVTVEEIHIPGAYDSAVKDVQGIVHAASSVNMQGGWKELVDYNVGGFKTILAAALNEKSIKRVVLTSSSCAVGSPNVNGKQQQRFTNSTWNDAAVRKAEADPQNVAGFVLYEAGKTLSEKFAWEFYKEHQPHWILNTICPNINFGGAVPGLDYQSTGQIVREIVYNGDSKGLINFINPQFQVDPEDAAIAHIVALTNASVKNERILTFGNNFTWDEIIDLGKKYRPEANVAAKSDKTSAVDNTIVDQERFYELLKPFGGPRSLAVSVEQNLR